MGWYNVFHLAYGSDLRPYELSVEYCVYFYTLCDNLQYLESVTYIMMCNGFVFGLGDYPMSLW